MKQYKVLQRAFSFLKKHNREEKVAEILLQYVTKQTPASFYAQMQTELPETVYKRFQAMLTDHALHGTPIQHMIGTAPFYGREFIVNEDVLIPRFETEEVVFHAIERMKQLVPEDESLTVVDLGTGSGIIALTLALELPQLTVYATDVSNHALQVAHENAAKHKVPVTLLQGDFLAPIIERELNPQVIISNPPYIAYEERHVLTDTVKKYDPALALFATNDGLAAYETIVKQITTLPRLEERLVIFEIGYNQKAAVTNIIKMQFPDSKINVYKDINGNDRIVIAYL